MLDFHQLVRALQEHPEWRAELRRLVLSDELLSLPEIVRDLAEAQRRTEQRIEELAEAQRRTEEALAQLTRRVEGLADQVGGLRGEIVERRYRERAHAYFGRILRRLRVLPPQELADLLDDAVDAGRLSFEERNAVLWADVVAEGRSPTGERVALVVEASATVSQRDVTRAVARAESFAKVTGLPTWPVVAGEGIAAGVQELAQRQGVWQVLDGRILPPGED